MGSRPAPGEVSSDATLVRSLLRQDVNAFEQLYERHSRVVYSLVLRILHQAATAEEVALCGQFLADQETLLRDAAATDPPSVARTYLVHALLNHNDFITIR